MEVGMMNTNKVVVQLNFRDLCQRDYIHDLKIHFYYMLPAHSGWGSIHPVIVIIIKGKGKTKRKH